MTFDPVSNKPLDSKPFMNIYFILDDKSRLITNFVITFWIWLVLKFFSFICPSTEDCSIVFKILNTRSLFCNNHCLDLDFIWTIVWIIVHVTLYKRTSIQINIFVWLVFTYMYLWQPLFPTNYSILLSYPLKEFLTA